MFYFVLIYTSVKLTFVPQKICDWQFSATIQVLAKIGFENKLCFLFGDFNINILKGARTLGVIYMTQLHDPGTCSSFKIIFHTYDAA